MRFLAVGACLLFALPVIAGDKIFEWVDANGVRHYANNPPSGTTSYVERDLQPREHTSGSPSDNYKVGEEGAAGNIEITTKAFNRTGPTQHKVIGTVKNSGKGPALNVRVKVTVKDPNQGNECSTSDATVDPVTMEPGATGKFEVTIESPCLVVEPPSIELAAVWNSDDEDETESTSAGKSDETTGDARKGSAASDEDSGSADSGDADSDNADEGVESDEGNADEDTEEDEAEGTDEEQPPASGDANSAEEPSAEAPSN